MRAAQAESMEDCEVKMKLVAPPLYVLTTYTLDKNKVRGHLKRSLATWMLVPYWLAVVNLSHNVCASPVDPACTCRA